MMKMIFSVCFSNEVLRLKLNYAVLFKLWNGNTQFMKVYSLFANIYTSLLQTEQKWKFHLLTHY